jgi:hypothetical protein
MTTMTGILNLKTKIYTRLTTMSLIYEMGGTRCGIVHSYLHGYGGMFTPPTLQFQVVQTYAHIFAVQGTRQFLFVTSTHTGATLSWVTSAFGLTNLDVSG